MSRGLKIALGIIAGMLVLCCLVGAALFYVAPRVVEDFVETSFTEASAEAADVAAEIMDYELPDGYAEEGAMAFFGMKMVMIVPSNQSSGMAFMLMQFPAAMRGNQADMQQQMEEAFARQTGRSDWELSFAGTDEVVINDETVALTIMEGSGEGGESARQVIGTFTAKSGEQAMVMVVGPVSAWDADAYEQFFNSAQQGRRVGAAARCWLQAARRRPGPPIQPAQSAEASLPG